MTDTEFEKLIQSITDLVLAKLQSMAHLTEKPKTLTVLWPVASGTKDLVMAGVSAFRQDPLRVQWLVDDALLDDLTPLLPSHERSRCHGLSRAPLQSILSNMQRTDVVLLAATHIEATRQLVALNDELSWIHVLLQAHMSGQQVVVCEDLLTPRGLSKQNTVAQEAAALKRQLRQMGFTLIPGHDLAKYLKELTLSSSHGAQEEGGLLTEQDVEDLVRAGQKELRLHPKTLVTPLAQSKAAELGLRLVRRQA